jgi:putative ubiquitin-RnfH superfamily antitoxin RatB of RatAB toxin-antitoxin module
MQRQADPVSAKVGPTTGAQRCLVVYATRDTQYLWTVELPLPATVGEAIEAARQKASHEGSAELVPWETAPVGIFGELCSRADLVQPDDRIELYRPLARNPRERRRARLERTREVRVSGPRA